VRMRSSVLVITLANYDAPDRTTPENSGGMATAVPNMFAKVVYKVEGGQFTAAACIVQTNLNFEFDQVQEFQADNTFPQVSLLKNCGLSATAPAPTNPDDDTLVTMLNEQLFKDPTQPHTIKCAPEVVCEEIMEADFTVDIAKYPRRNGAYTFTLNTDNFHCPAQCGQPDHFEVGNPPNDLSQRLSGEMSMGECETRLNDMIKQNCGSHQEKPCDRRGTIRLAEHPCKFSVADVKISAAVRAQCPPDQRIQHHAQQDTDIDINTDNPNLWGGTNAFDNAAAAAADDDTNDDADADMTGNNVDPTVDVAMTAGAKLFVPAPNTHSKTAKAKKKFKFVGPNARKNTKPY
jgi:hypothetical protein